MTLGPASQFKKTFFIFFSASLSIAILDLTSTAIFELELAILEQLPMRRRVCCEIHGILFFFFCVFLLLSVTEALLLFRSTQYFK